VRIPKRHKASVDLDHAAGESKWSFRAPNLSASGWIQGQDGRGAPTGFGKNGFLDRARDEDQSNGCT
jgi:hypothetical protein